MRHPIVYNVVFCVGMALYLQAQKPGSNSRFEMLIFTLCIVVVIIKNCSEHFFVLQHCLRDGQYHDQEWSTILPKVSVQLDRCIYNKHFLPYRVFCKLSYWLLGSNIL